MKILVTGASGFVGGAFIKRYMHNSDIELIGLGRQKNSFFKNYIQHDLSKELELSFNPDVVIHAAAHVSSWDSRSKFLESNVETTKNIVNFCKLHAFPRLIYISSSSVYYKNEDQINITESTAVANDFLSYYAESKYLGEEEIRRYPGEYIIVRPCAIFGNGDVNLLPPFIDMARNKNLWLIENYGKVVITDFVHIDTLCEYLFKIAEDKNPVGCINISNGYPVNLNDFIFNFLERSGIEPPKKNIPFKVAWYFAKIVEKSYPVIPWIHNPSITSFSISMFGYSRSYDTSLVVQKYGHPCRSIEDGIEEAIFNIKSMNI